MMTGPRMLTAAAFLPLIACAGHSQSAHNADAAPPEPEPIILAQGMLASATAQPRGTVRVITETPRGAMRVVVRVTGMSAGTYGAHIHDVGRCDAPAFTSAGPHWNPTARQHGRLNPQGSHSGDMPNLVIGADGSGSFEVDVPGPLFGEGGLLDANGASLVIHARADDERTDPSGNSGDRIVCGVIHAPPMRR
jgi:superoxide dismutase, Cu-Zn family